jgi:uncharacterized protein with GYD domain
MATFVSLLSFTDQGVRNVKESPSRVEAFKGMADKSGVTVKSVYYTIGAYDLVIVTEGPEEAATALLLKLGSLGNVRTQTMRGFSVDEMKSIVGKLPQ